MDETRCRVHLPWYHEGWTAYANGVPMLLAMLRLESFFAVMEVPWQTAMFIRHEYSQGYISAVHGLEKNRKGQLI